MSDTPFNPEILNTLVKRQDIGGDCTLWLLDMTQMPVLMPEDIVEILHESAVIRYSELSRKQRRTQFVIGRLLTRYAVSTLLNRPMHDFALIERRSNTPQLRALPPLAEPLYYSLAYRYDYAACVTSRSHRVGLDIEIADKDREIATPAETSFNDNENRWLSAKPAENWHEGYYELWTRKEACFKLLSNKHGGIQDDRFWQTDCLNDTRFSWTTRKAEDGLIITICQSDPDVAFELTQTSSYNLDNAFDIFKR